MREIYLGPPGTGKTTTLLNIVEDELASGTPPERIAYVSFTKKAATEASERAAQKFSTSAADFPYFRTLHSLSFRTMGYDRSDVFDHLKLPDYGKWAGVKVTGRINMDEGSTFGNEEGDRCLFLINLSRLRMEPLRETYSRYYDDIPWRTVEYVAESVKKYKQANFLVDYTDMLEQFARNSWSPDVDVVIIDEAQDLSKLQWRVVAKLCTNARRVIIAGDDDQAIYQWAGADVDYFINMEGVRTVLHQSYRIPAKVQEISNDIVRRIQNRNEKRWHPRDAQGVVERSAKLDGVDWNSSSTLVLARNVKYLDEISNWLMNRGINYEFRGKEALSADVRSAIKTWQNLRDGMDAEIGDVRRVYGYMVSGKQVARGYKSLPGFQDNDLVRMGDLVERAGLTTDAPWYVALPKIPKREHDFVRTAVRTGERLDMAPRIRLSTIHSSKGGEGDHVVIVPDMAGRTYSDSLKDMDSEHRVWYVAVTRAKEKLTILNPEYKNSYPL
jgi:superfamily I DNA/RNA helicase